LFQPPHSTRPSAGAIGRSWTEPSPAGSVNVADRTVTFMDYVTPLTGVSATLVSFSGQQAPVVFGVKTKPFTIDGRSIG
jgi:hypothetical protein